MSQDISFELTEIRQLLFQQHLATMDTPEGWGYGWMMSMPDFRKCGCRLCRAMIRITALEVNTTLNPKGIGEQ